MKKYILLSGIALIAISSASAEQTGQVRPMNSGKVMMTTNGSMVMQGRSGTISANAMMMAPPVITTGDATTDATIKALQDEMETKIKAIREEYQAKIKAAIGDKQVTIKQGNGSSTMPMRMKGEGEGRGTMMHESSSTMMRHDGDMVRGSTTEGGPAMRPEGHMPVSAQVEGESNGGSAPTPAPHVQGGLRGFFNKIFGR